MTLSQILQRLKVWLKRSQGESSDFSVNFQGLDTPQVAQIEADPLADILGLANESNDSKINLEDDHEKISKEISNYFKFETPGAGTLDWWRQNSGQLPLLKQLAAKYLGIPATSASSERSFSSAGLTAAKLRSRLTGSHVECLNLLHCNKNKLDF